MMKTIFEGNLGRENITPQVYCPYPINKLECGECIPVGCTSHCGNYCPTLYCGTPTSYHSQTGIDAEK